jgi:hypothetical protein
MSTSLVSSKRTKIQKVCTLWTHDENFSKENVVFNEEKFPELPLSPTSLIQILALKHAPAVRDFQVSSKNKAKDSTAGRVDESGPDGHPEARSKRSRRGSTKITLDENGAVIPGGRDVDPERSYIFVAKPMSPDLRSKHPTLQVILWRSYTEDCHLTRVQVSIAEKVAKVFGFRNRLQVVVTEAS